MIEISLGTAIAVYGAVVAIGALALWLYSEITTQRSHKILERQHLWRCVYCAYVYLDESGQPVSECPRCHSLNHEGDKGARYVRPVKRPKLEPTVEVGEMPRRNPSRGKRPGARRRGPRRRGR